MRKTHGYTASRTYTAWDHMRQRCENPANASYHNYGGRGITVCPEWADFACFLADMGEAPAGKTLERQRNGEGYSKGNCCWATRLEQNQNSRKKRRMAMRADEAITALDALVDDDGDIEKAHMLAEGVLLAYLRASKDGCKIADAYARASARTKFYYS